MTADDFKAIIGAITHKLGWTFLLAQDGERWYVQASVSTESDLTMDPTRRTQERTAWKSGKRYLSPFMCRQEVVGTVLGLIKEPRRTRLTNGSGIAARPSTILTWTLMFWWKSPGGKNPSTFARTPWP